MERSSTSGALLDVVDAADALKEPGWLLARERMSARTASRESLLDEVCIRGCVCGQTSAVCRTYRCESSSTKAKSHSSEHKDGAHGDGVEPAVGGRVHELMRDGVKHSRTDEPTST